MQDAIQALRDLQDALGQDDENALTADIEAATKAITMLLNRRQRHKMKLVMRLAA